MLDGKASVTALIPAFFGIILALLGVLANSKPNLRKHVMHVAVLVGLAGFIVPLVRILSKLSTISLSPAVLSQISMALICLIFVALCVKSFIDARRSGAV
jgi:methyl coenzyme M reductase subunit C